MALLASLCLWMCASLIGTFKAMARKQLIYLKPPIFIKREPIAVKIKNLVFGWLFTLDSEIVASERFLLHSR